MPESTFTLRLDASLKETFTEVAKTQDRTAAQLLRDFMRDYIAQNRKDAGYDAWFQQKVEQGRQAYLDGDFMTNDAVEAEAKARRERLLQDHASL